MPIQPIDPGKGPQQCVLSQEKTEALYEAMKPLPTKMRRCLELRFRDQLTIREIAEVLRIEQGTVKKHLQEGRRRLSSVLRERFGIADPLDLQEDPS